MDRAKAVDYAKQFWFQPCDDHIFWTASEGIDVRTLKTQLLAKKRIKSDWEAVFLRKQVTDRRTGATGEADGLYFVAPAHVGKHFWETDIPAGERYLANDWYGTAGVPGSPGGLNDCTVYVSHCLDKGEVTGLGPVAPATTWPTRSPQQLYNLKNRPVTETKLITQMASRADTEAVFAALSHVLKPGDVLTFAADGRQEHAGMLVSVDPATGAAKMTCHSTMDHPDLGPTWGSWQFRTLGSEHPFVSVIHFSSDDPAPGALAGVAGWWTVDLGGDRFWYYLTADGASRRVRRKPASAGAPSSYDLAGHWYAGKTPDDMVIVWTTGQVATVTVDLDVGGFGGSERGIAVVGNKGV